MIRLTTAVNTMLNRGVKRMLKNSPDSPLALCVESGIESPGALTEEFTMRNLLALVGLALVVFLVAGNYLGWYTFNSSTGLDGKKHISFEVDTKKIESDSKQGIEKVVDKGSDVVDNLKKNQHESNTITVTAPPSLSSNLFGPPAKTNER